MNDEKSCKTATKFFGVIGTCIVLSLSLLFCPLIASATELNVPFIAVDSISTPWNVQFNLTLEQTPSNDNSNQYTINPFKSMRITDPESGVNGIVTPITETFDNYGYAYHNGPTSNSSTYLTLSTDAISTSGGAINAVNIQMCVPMVSNEVDLVERSNYNIRVAGVSYSPDYVTFSKSLPYYMSNIYGAPVETWTFYIYNVLIYFDDIIEILPNSYISISVPITSFNFTMDLSYTVGCVFAINDAVVDYFPSFEAAQNDIIINNLEKFPQKDKYNDTIEDNESLGDEFSKVGDFEESLYDNLPDTSGLPEDVDNDVRLLFGGLSFIYEQPFVITLITIGISCAILSYALYGGS